MGGAGGMNLIAPQRKLLAHPERLAALKAGTPFAPVNVEIDLSNRCSLGCEWCHFAYTHTRGPLKGKREKPVGAIPGGDLMDAYLALRIIDELAAADVQSITWTGGGEPTLHPDFDKIIAYAGKRLQQGIYTHGGHIDGWRAELLKRNMEFVYVSLDAANRDDYLRDKGVDRFHIVCANIARLAKAPGDATIGVGYLITKDNWHRADVAAGLARAYGADYIQFRPTIHYDQAHPDSLDEDVEWLGEALEFLENVAANYPNVELDADRFRMYQTWIGHGYPICLWSMLQTVITPSGQVWTCVNKREHPAALLGDLTTEPFAELWGRQSPASVDSHCRVMCRGHLANQVLADVLAEPKHGAFI